MISPSESRSNSSLCAAHRDARKISVSHVGKAAVRAAFTVRTVKLLALGFGLAAMGLSSARANSELDVLNGQTDLSQPATYGGTTPTTTNDVTFTNQAYSSAAFTLGSSISIGTLNDLSSTALTIANSSGAADTITLNGGGDTVAGSAPGDLLFVASGGSLTLTGGTGTTALGLVLAASGNFDIAGTGTAAISSIVSGGFGITKTGGGTLTLSGANTYTGGTTLSAGTLLLGNAAAAGTGTITLNGGTLGASGAQTITNTLIAATGSTTTLQGTGTLTLNGILSGSGILNVGAAGFNLTTGTLNNTSIGRFYGYTGTLNVGGVLGFNSPNSANGADFYYNLSNAAVVLNTGGSTQFNSGNGAGTNDPGVAYVNFGSISGTTGTLGGAAGGTNNTKGVRYVVGTLNTDTTFGGVIVAGTNQLGDTLTKVGTGTLTLTGANTYTGITYGTFSIPATTIRGGTLQVGNGTSGSLAATGAMTFQDSGRFNYQGQTTGSAQALGTLTFTAGAGTVQSTYGTSGTTNLTYANVAARTTGATGNFVVSGGANGSTNLIVFTQVAGAAPTSGAQLDRGFFFGGTNYAAYDTGGFVRAYGAADANYATAAGANGIASVATNNTALTSDVTAQNTATVNTLNLGAFSVSLSSGQTLQTSGILSAGNGSATISGGTALQSASGAELVIRINGATDALNISVPITANGANALTKTGAGTLTLSATGNTYTGATYIDEGTLTFSGTNTANTGGIVVNNTGTLNLSGTFTTTGTMTVANGSGNGMVNVSSGAVLTLGTTSGVNGMNISNSATGYDTGNGTVNVSGTLTSLGDSVVGLGGTQTGKLVINNGGIVNLGTTVQKALQIGQYDTVSGQIDLNTGGTLNLNTNSLIRFSSNSGGGTNVFNQNGGNVVSYSNNGTTQGGTGSLDLQRATAATANNTYNLNGGTLSIPQVFSTATDGTRTFNFNGGTLRVASNNAAANFFNLGTGNARANVRNGGVIIDTNGFGTTATPVTIVSTLLHSNISGDNATDGGLTKNGIGVLTLAAANTYTGPTSVTAGALTLNTATALSDTSALSLVTGTTLNLNAANGTSEIVGGLILNGVSEPAGTYTFTQLNAFDPNITFTSSSGETLTIAPVPEPATWLGAFLLVGPLGYCQRRNISRALRTKFA